jgi:hypothetical protein
MTYRPMDQKAAENLASVVRGDSHYVTTVHVNSRGRAFVNVVDPEKKVRPFTLRDRVDWDDKKPKKKRNENAS